VTKSCVTRSSNKIEVTVRHQQKIVKFALRKTAPLEKVFVAFAKSMNVPRATFRFVFAGSRLRGEETPESLEMDDDDEPEIEAHLMQVGGELNRRK